MTKKNKNVNIDDILNTSSKRLSVSDILRLESGVMEFNNVFGNNPSNKDLVEVYANLTIEEVKEGMLAEINNDDEEHIDALVDTVFTGFYLNRLVEGHPLYEEVSFLEELCTGEYGEYTWEELISTLEHKEYSNFVARFIYKLIVQSEKYDILGAFDRVFKSNMSKCICKNDVISGLVSLEAAIQEVQDAGRYDDLFWEETEEHFILKAKIDKQENKVYDSGKIVKIESLYSSVQDLGGLSEFVRK